MLETVVVTGASGFIGRSLLTVGAREVWRDRYRFVALSSHQVGAHPWVDGRRDKDGLYGFSEADFRLAGADRVDHLIHLGAFTPKDGAEANDVKASLANIVNIPRLLGALPGPLQSILFASSIDVYGCAQEPFVEDKPCYPATLYGHSKLFGERMLEALMATHDNTTLQILRLGHTYGPGEERYRKFIPEAIRQLLDGKAPIFTATGDERRSFIYVEDCCEKILTALGSETGAGPINIASAIPASLRDVAGHLQRIHKENGGDDVEFTWAGKAKRGRDVVPDVQKMRRLLGEDATALLMGLRAEYAYFAGGADAVHP